MFPVLLISFYARRSSWWSSGLSLLFNLLLPKLMPCYRQLFWSCLVMCPVIFRLRHLASSLSSFMSAFSSNSSMLTWSGKFTRPVPPASHPVSMRSLDDYTDYESSLTIQICITSPLSYISRCYLGTEIVRWRSPLKLKKVKLLNFVFRDMRCWPSRLTPRLVRARFFTSRPWRKLLSCRTQLTCAISALNE